MATATKIVENEIKALLNQGLSPYQVEARLTAAYGFRVMTARHIYRLKPLLLSEAVQQQTAA